MAVDRILLRRDTAANWTAANPVLALGEEGVELDTLRRKFGDGVTTWTALPYAVRPPADLDGDMTAKANDTTSQFYAAQRAAIDAEGQAKGWGTGGYTDAAAVSAVEAAASVAPTGAWNFSQTPTVNGTALGSGGGGASNLAVVDVLPASPVTGTVYILTGDTSTPSTPTGLTATPGDTQVALSWTVSTDNAGVTNYRVYRGGNPVASPTGTSYTDTGLTDGTAYSYTVSAMDAAGHESPQTAAVTATPVAAGADTTAPSVPGTPTATAGSAQATVSFGASTDNVGVTGYRVYSSADSYTAVAASGSASPITVTGLTNGTAYTFEVTAYDAAGNESAKSAASNSVTPTASTTVPGAPTGVTATAGNAQASVSWTAPASNGGAAITDYVIQYSSDSGTTWTTFADGTSTATSATVTGLTNGTAYVFHVAAVNSVGQGAYSSASAAVTPTASVTTLDSTAFTQADGSGLPATDQGRTWTAFGVAGTAPTFGVKTNQAYVYATTAANPAGAVIDVATANVTVQATLATVGTTNAGVGLIIGYADSSNFVYATQTSIAKYVGGTYTSLGTFTTAFASGAVMKVSRSGSTINVYQNGTLIKTVTVADTAITAATKHGLMFRGNDTTSRLDDWSVTTP